MPHRRKAPRSVLPTLLLLALAVGAGGAAWEASNLVVDATPLPVQDRATTPSAPPLAQMAAAAAPDVGVLVNYPETIARPLFNPTRRPIEPTAPKAAEQAAPPTVAPLQAQLVGVAVSSSNGGRALVRSANERAASWLSVGEELAGWRLVEIASDHVVFKSGTSRQELRLVTPRTKAARAQQPQEAR